MRTDKRITDLEIAKESQRKWDLMETKVKCDYVCRYEAESSLLKHGIEDYKNWETH